MFPFPRQSVGRFKPESEVLIKINNCKHMNDVMAYKAMRNRRNRVQYTEISSEKLSSTEIIAIFFPMGEKRHFFFRH